MGEVTLEVMEWVEQSYGGSSVIVRLIKNEYKEVNSFSKLLKFKATENVQ